jgi:cyclic beta-1,2-glucan synthetase
MTTRRVFDTAHQTLPHAHLLSNGRYCVMVSAAGSGYSRWGDLSLTRWREDSTRDPWGTYIYLRDVGSGQVWSAGFQPIGCEPTAYEVEFSEERARISRRDGSLHTVTEILVSGEQAMEVRRVSVTNTENRTREIELTSYAEVVLASEAADSAHPAFSKMFVQTEFAADGATLLATRRPREPADAPLWMFHRCTLDGKAVGTLQFETDRARFVGRGHDLRTAVSITEAQPLSNTAGTVLDPILSLRWRVRIGPGETVRADFWYGVAESRAAALTLANAQSDPAAFERAAAAATAASRAALQRMSVSEEEAVLFQRVAGPILYADPSLRAPAALLDGNRLGPAALWPFGISGDFPVVLLRQDDAHRFDLVQQLLRAHEFWRSKHLAVDLVILDECAQASDVQQALQAAVEAAASAGADADKGHGRVFVLAGDAMQAAAKDALQVTARAIFRASSGSLEEQLAGRDAAAPTQAPERAPPGGAAARVQAPPRTPPLDYFNGFGGFAAAGREYVTVLDKREWTPAPWVNVIANPDFGFLASADGVGTTWSLNARENQLTPWSNDPVSNDPAEAIYLRDEDSGAVWSATPLPIRQPNFSYVVRHGFGYSRYEHNSHGIASDLLHFVPLEGPIKIARLTLVNRSKSTRRLSITHYLDWVLGNQRSRTAPYLITRVEPRTGALLAQSPWSNGFQDRVAFLDMGGRQQSVSGDRAEFLGRHGSLREPRALFAGTRSAASSGLSNRVGGGLDPCGVLQGTVALQPGERTEFVLLLGQESSQEAAAALIERYRTADLDAVFKEVTDYWDQTVGAIQVKTPDASLDLLVNGWLLYQTLACRLWARTGFYQASGAWGYRDQLQDSMALCIARPAVAREHILRAASRQFMAGDVQHWWLPVSGQGIRTRIADDRVWLPYVVAHYLDVTQDLALLDVEVGYLRGDPLADGQLELFASFPAEAHSDTLYEHCVRALDSSLAIGSHGLPLFGTGDWNDGMNRVGLKGLGETVWLAWFLYATLERFAVLAERREDVQHAASWRKHAYALQQAIEREAWDGDWYRRGYYDDGTPLGSVSSEECRIDSVAQSWAVLSGAADGARAARAMAAVNAQLVSRADGLVHLFTPPFDRTSHDPGYIKAYPPGLRENGGQYTHAALWTSLAFAQLGDGDRAAEIFSLLNPISHSSTNAAIHRYKVEPYVVCADVYSAPAHVGRGGWTWYTGSAGWMYRTAVEGMLGITVRGARLSINPCIPRAWPGFEMTYKHGASRYRVAVENPHGVSRGLREASLDGQPLAGPAFAIDLHDDGSYHYVRIVLG